MPSNFNRRRRQETMYQNDAVAFSLTSSNLKSTSATPNSIVYLNARKSLHRNAWLHAINQARRAIVSLLVKLIEFHWKKRNLVSPGFIQRLQVGSKKCVILGIHKSFWKSFENKYQKINANTACPIVRQQSSKVAWRTQSYQDAVSYTHLTLPTILRV